MEPFSVASVTASFSSISHRALSAAAELDGLPDDGQLSGLSVLLRRISDEAASLQVLLPRCTVLSVAVQTELVRQLKVCEDAVAVIEKQLRRLSSMDQRWEIDSAVVAAYANYLQLEASLSEAYKFVFQADDTATQEEILRSGDLQRIIAGAEQAASQVMQRADILRPRDSGAGSASDNPPGYDHPTGGSPVFGTKLPLSDGGKPVFDGAPISTGGPSVLPPTTPAGESTSKGSKGKGRGLLSGLAHSLQAATAALRPTPEPFVVPLCQAARRGDEAQIKGLLAQGANINGRNEEGQTALICAIDGLQHSTIQFLIICGASIAVKDSKGKPPLFHAAGTGDVEVVRTLLLHGANPNEKNTSGKPYFVDAALKADLDTVRLLLDYGADVNTRDLTGQSILVRSVKAQNIQLFRLLVDRGADVNSRDITGQTVLVTVIQAERMDLAKHLLDRGADANARDLTGRSMLVHAAERGNMELVKLLLDHGSDPNVRDLLGRSMLIQAVESNNEELAKLLLDHGSDPNVKDNLGYPAFLNVIRKGNMQTAKMFLERGVDPNQQFSHSGETPLLYAIHNEKWDLATLILKYGGNPNVAGRSGNTPLLEAMQKNNTRLMQLLLQRGANIHQEGTITPLGFAQGNSRKEMVQFLQSQGAHGVIDHSGSSAQGGSGSNARAQPPEGGDEDAPPDYESASHGMG